MAIVLNCSKDKSINWQRNLGLFSISWRLELLFEKFMTMAKYYKYFIEYSSKMSQQKYNLGVVWTCIQNVLMQLLDEYLDIKQAGQQSVMTQSEILERLDVNSFFAKKRLINLNFNTEWVLDFCCCCWAFWVMIKLV